MAKKKVKVSRSPASKDVSLSDIEKMKAMDSSAMEEIEPAEIDLNEDFEEAPLSDKEKGEMEGVKTYNEMVDPVNAVLRTGAPMRKKYSPEAEAQMQKDKEALEKSQKGRSISSVKKKYKVKKNK